MDELIALLSSAQTRPYIGEPVSQTEHALQAAYFATCANRTEEEIIAALLHDIGHLLMGDPLSDAVDLGIHEHDLLGARYLMTLGAPTIVIELVSSHVQAKRYLVTTSQRYCEKLSAASISTLALQGGPMSAEEATLFERAPLFQEKIALRAFDDRAKVINLAVPSISHYVPMLKRHFRTAV